MRHPIRLACALVLLWGTACSDDGAPGQGQNATGASASTGAETSQATGGTEGANDSTGSLPPGTGTGDPGATTMMPGDSSGTGRGSDTGTGTGTGSDSGTSGDTGTTTSTCEPINPDPTEIGMECQIDANCPMGYTCQPFSGVVLQMTCQILCEDDCECPMGLTCNETVDKTQMPWFQCG